VALSGFLRYLRSSVEYQKWKDDADRLALDAPIPYKLGFTNMTELSITDEELKVEGDIPAWLNGTLFRGGPGVFDVKTISGNTKHVPHWFDGLAVMNKFTVENGKVRYSRRPHSEPFIQYLALDNAAPIQFGEDPCHSIFQGLQSVFTMGNAPNAPDGRLVSNVNVTVKKIRGRYYNCTDSSRVQEFDPETVETVGDVEFFDQVFKVKGMERGVNAASHAHYDQARGETWNFVSDLRGKSYKVFAVPDDPDEPTRMVGVFPNVPLSYLHSSSMTPKYFILIVWPLRISLPRLLYNKSLMGAMDWHANEPTMIYVMDRQSGEVVLTTSCDAFFCFHTVNGYEREDGKVVVQLVTYPDDKIVRVFQLENVRGGGYLYDGTLQEIILPDPLSGETPDKVAVRTVSQAPIELPRINPRYYLREHRYVYGIGGEPGKGEIYTRIHKIDVADGTAVIWDGNPGDGSPCLFPMEAIFIPRPEADAEDDGVLVSIVLDATNKNSFLLVLDPSTMTEMARATVSTHIPFAFHGNYFPSDQSTSTDTA